MGAEKAISGGPRTCARAGVLFLGKNASKAGLSAVGCQLKAMACGVAVSAFATERSRQSAKSISPSQVRSAFSGSTL